MRLCEDYSFCAPCQDTVIQKKGYKIETQAQLILLYKGCAKRLHKNQVSTLSQEAFFAKHYGFFADLVTKTDKDWGWLFWLSGGWSMQMQPLESQTGWIRETEHVDLCVTKRVCEHTQDSFFTIGPGECFAPIPFEAHNPSLMFVAGWSFIYLEPSLVWHDSSFTLPCKVKHVEEPCSESQTPLSTHMKEKHPFYLYLYVGT